jgi:hypothetical protein
LIAVSGGIYVNMPTSYSLMHLNKKSLQSLTSDGILMSRSPFTLARVRLRRVKFTSAAVQQSTRFGLYPDSWLHVSGGIVWPWDGTELPFGLFPGGVT